MYTQKRSQKVFVSYLCVFIWFFILTLVTVPLYQKLIIQLELKAMKQIELQKETEKLGELQDIRNLMQEVWGEIFEKVTVLSKEFSEIEVFDYLHNYTRTLSGTRDMIVLREISFSPAGLSDIGFQKTRIDISMVVSSEEALFNFMQYLTEDIGEYKFFIPSFSYPLWEIQGNFLVQLPLVLYHR